MSQASTPVTNAAALVKDALRRLDGATPQATLEWALGTFGSGRIALCTSFQHEGMVLLDMAWRIDPAVSVFTIDSGRLPQETLDLVEEVRQRYAITVEVVYPEAAEVSRLVSRHGPNLFYQSAELRLSCCEARKVNPLKRRLGGLDAWISGLRRHQNATRAEVAVVETDALHGGIVKVNPLAGWGASEVMSYAEANRLPRNVLYGRGYTSIGCAPCTRATEPGEDPRAGRWWWEQGARECGLHYDLEVAPDGSTRLASVRGGGRASAGSSAASLAPEVDDA
ncbi:MAG: phosphoadenylyl-sulfate reductase [Candidatus Dormibacteraeota bacterium]|nr:phosphoadenylyl-sulfate reductase [Candidatus Dormibacteraeota bacterium]